MAKISVVIDTYNKEQDLPRCLESVKDVADEILVCDEGSSDKTLDIARKYGAKIITHETVPYVELIRNYEVSKASGDWILVLDPDEEISKSLAVKIKEIVKKPQADYYRLPRKNLVFGKGLKHSRWWPDYNIRLFKKGHVSWSEVIHAVPMTQGKGLDLPADEKYAIVHHHYDSIEQYLERLNRYTSVQAELKAKEGYDFSYLDLIKKPSSEFLSRFFAGEGYKDGIHGLSLSLLQAFSELVVYLKLWQRGGFKDEKLNLPSIRSEVKRVVKDTGYWFSDSFYKSTGSVAEIVKRKFKIL